MLKYVITVNFGIKVNFTKFYIEISKTAINALNLRQNSKAI